MKQYCQITRLHDETEELRRVKDVSENILNQMAELKKDNACLRDIMEEMRAVKVAQNDKVKNLDVVEENA